MKYFLAFFLLISMSIAPVSAQVLSSGPTYSDFRIDNQDIRMYTARISTDSGKYGVFWDFQSKLIAQCEDVASEFGADTSECDEVSLALQRWVTQLKTGNTRTIRTFLSNPELSWWIGDLLLPDDVVEMYSAFNILGSRTYKNWAIFLAKQYSPYGGTYIDNYYVGFIRYDAKYREIKANLTPLAPEGSPQFATYEKLYDDTTSFERDVRKAFLANKFSNKNTQSVYATFLANLWTN